MNEPAVTYSLQDHVARLTLNRAEIDLEIAQGLAEIAARINGDETVYVVTLTGSRTVFCSGGNREDLTVAQENDLLPGKLSPAEAMASITRPTLAVLNGDALGMGLELALACDLRLASDRARFALTQLEQGALPMDGGTQRLARLVGRGKALEMLFTAEVLDAAAALEAGLVNKVVSPEELQEEAAALARIISAKAPLALRYCKEAVNQGLNLGLEQGLHLEADLYFLLHTTSDRTEGIKSFLAKKPPHYEGR